MWLADRGQHDLGLVEIGGGVLQVWLHGVVACLAVDWFSMTGSGAGLVFGLDPA